MSIFAKHVKHRQALRSEDGGAEDVTVIIPEEPEVEEGVVTPELNAEGEGESEAESGEEETPETNEEEGETEEETPSEEEPSEEPTEQNNEEETSEEEEEGEGEDGGTPDEPEETSSDEDDEEDDDVFTEIDEETGESDRIGEEVTQLTNVKVALESYGISASTMGVLKAARFLNGTALESIGLESFVGVDAKGAEYSMALEALEEKTEEKRAEWSAKIVGVAKKVGEKVHGVLSKIWEKLKSAVTRAAEGVKETAKAHPYATIASVATAVTVAAAAVAWFSGNLPLPGAKTEAIESFRKSFGEKIAKIKWPFGKVKVEASDLKFDLVKTSNVAAEGATAKLGWTKNAIKSIENLLGRAWTQVTTAVGALGTRATKIVGALGQTKTAGHAVKGWTNTVEYFKTFGESIRAVSKVIKDFIVDGFRVILSTITALLGRRRETIEAAA